MNSKTRIKVDRDALIERLKTRQSEEDEAYRVSLEQYRKDKAAYPRALAAALTDVAKQIRAGDLAPSKLTDRYGGWRTSLLPAEPVKPSKPRGNALAIAQLEMAVDDAILISGEDFAAYMR